MATTTRKDEQTRRYSSQLKSNGPIANGTRSAATAVAGANIAFVKYWGNADDALNIPMNGSISMTLDGATTKTTVEFSPDYSQDRLTINDRRAGHEAVRRVSLHLDQIRKLAGSRHFAHVSSHNSFPTGAGIASSASGFAALTVAACAALGLDLPNRALSQIARLGSGSACRSIDGGFVEWQPGSRHEDSYAVPLAPADHWDLVDIVAIVSAAHKETGSSEGHSIVHTSPFYRSRLDTLPHLLSNVRQAIVNRDLAVLGPLIEAEAISMHAAAMTANPSTIYWLPGTLRLMHLLRRWREAGGPIGYFTIDAGPNVHIITERRYAAALQAKIAAVADVGEIIVCGIGADAALVDNTGGNNEYEE